MRGQSEPGRPSIGVTQQAGGGERGVGGGGG